MSVETQRYHEPSRQERLVTQLRKIAPTLFLWTRDFNPNKRLSNELFELVTEIYITTPPSKEAQPEQFLTVAELAREIQDCHKLLAELERESDSALKAYFRSLKVRLKTAEINITNQQRRLSNQAKKEISRREFFTRVTGAGVLVLLAEFGLLGKLIWDDHNELNHFVHSSLIPSEAYSDRANAAIKFLSQVYKLRVFIDDFSYDEIAGSGLFTQDLEHCLAVLVTQVMKYPPSFFTENHIPVICFARSVQIDSRKVGGTVASVWQHHIPIVGNIGGEDFLAKTIHHEIYHALDLQNGFTSAEITAWQSTFPCDCEVYPFDHTKRHDQLDTNMFVSQYAGTRVTEDKAEMAETMLIRDKYITLLERLDDLRSNGNGRSAAVLQEKVNLIKSDYFAWSKGLMNEQFWEDLINGRSFNPVYWQIRQGRIR